MAQKKQQEQSVVRISPTLHRKLKSLAGEKKTTLQALTEAALRRVYKQLESEAA